MNATAYTTRAPRSTVLHLSKQGELTLCGRLIPATWSLEPAQDVDVATCGRCRGYVWTLDSQPHPARTETPADVRAWWAHTDDAVQLEDEQTADQLADAAAHLQAAEGVTERVEQLYADARSRRAQEELDAVQLEDEQPATPQLPRTEDAGVLLVVPCSGAKLEHAAPAEKLYHGTLTTMGLAAAASVVQSFADTRVVILSALHGLVDPDRVLAPYDVKMGDPGSITTEQLAEQLRATGARRVIALTPNGYTAALVAACMAAGLELPEAPLAGSRGIGEQRGRLATLRRSAGYGEDWGLTSRAELQRQADAELVEAAAQRMVAGQPAGLPAPDTIRTQRMLAAATERAQELLVLEAAGIVPADRCRESLAGGMGPCAAPAGHDGRGHDLTGQPVHHAAAAQPLVHLMDLDGLDTCGTAPAGRLLTAPDTTPERITCPRCLELLAKAQQQPGAAPPVHGPGQPEQFGRETSCAETLLDRGRRAILRVEQLQRRARQAVQLPSPAGTLHA